MLVPPMELSTITNNQPAMTVRNGVIQTPPDIKLPMIQEFIAVTTLYNTGVNRTPWIIIRTGINGSTPV